MDHSAHDEDQRGNERDGQQDADGATHQVDPEVAEVAGAGAGESAHQRHGDGHADGGGDEVLHGESGHLDEVALGALTGVGLPVGVGDEADGGVPGQRRGHLGGGGRWGCRGSLPCTSWKTNSAKTLIAEKASTLRA